MTNKMGTDLLVIDGLTVYDLMCLSEGFSEDWNDIA